MRKKAKIATIYEAWTTPLPIGEPWYEERLSKCDTCEHNSKNGEKSLKDKALSVLYGGDDFCLICKCPLAKKASMKEEECGLAEIGIEPKWHKLKVVTADPNDFNIYNNTPEKIKIDLDEQAGAYIADYGRIDKHGNTSVQLLIEGKYMAYAAEAGCSCTKTNLTKLSNELYALDVSIDLDKVHQKFTKSVTVRFLANEGNSSFTILFKGMKK